jgi:hypothetical protein
MVGSLRSLLFIVADIIAAVPHFWLLVALSLVALGVEIAILAISLARLDRQETARRRAEDGDWQGAAALEPLSRLLEIFAALIPLAVGAAFARAIQDARNVYAFATTPAVAPEDKALMASRAISAELNTIPMGLWAVGGVVLLGCAAVAAAVSARQRGWGLRQAAGLALEAPSAATALLKFPGPRTAHLLGGIAGFVILGFAPMAQGGFSAIVAKIRAFSTVAGLPPDQKGAFFDHALDDATRLLDERFVFARVGIVVAAIVAGFLAWWLSPARARARLLGATKPAVAHEGARGTVIAFAVIALAVVGFAAARPLRAENQSPWPPFEGGERLMALIATPDLEGPDVMERAPVVYLTPDAMGLDGRSADADAIAMQLNSLRQSDSTLFPNEPFNGQVLIVCEADTNIDRLTAALRAVVSGGMPRATFVFLRRQVVDRPLIGHRWRNRARAARTIVVESKADVESDATTIIPVGLFPTCAALSQEIVNARRGGHEVAVLLP